MPAEARTALTWVREEPAVWDADKARVIGGAPAGAFVLPYTEGEGLAGDWWSVSDGTGVVGYGRLDVTWGGDAEILLAVDPERQGAGIGTFVLDRLDEEAAARGLNYVHNRIREHEQRDLVHDWLVVRGFRGRVDGDLRKRVGTTHETPSSRRTGPASEAGHERGKAGGQAGGQADGEAGGADQAPGREDQGGYVDVDEHHY